MAQPMTSYLRSLLAQAITSSTLLLEALGLYRYTGSDSSWTNGETLTISHGAVSNVWVTGYKVTSAVPTIIMMHGNGSDGSTTLTEQNGKTVSNSGCAISTAQKVFGTGSILCSPAGDSFTVGKSGWEFNDGSWTLELRFRPTDLGVSSGGRWLVADFENGSTTAFGFNISTAALLLYASSNGSSWNIASGTNCGTLSVNTWYHLVLQYDGSFYDVYLDGSRVAHISSASALYATTQPITFGKHPAEAGAYFVGYYDEIALHGSAIYSGASITVPTAEYSDGTVKTGLRHGVDFTYTWDSAGTYPVNISGSTLNVRFDVLAFG